jgi:hypothetical protein
MEVKAEAEDETWLSLPRTVHCWAADERKSNKLKSDKKVALQMFALGV